ncbi:MAG TPA: hypothetical protein PLQ11_08055 [Beijerinckiaceae bacterium]|nr:hypothetical protein [Beijerinckiaceae bacterium]
MRAGRALMWLVVIGGAVGTVPAVAQQMPESCQKDFVPLMQKRQQFMATIEGYRKRKPTAAQACGTFRNLAVHNKKLADWMTAQKDWCQIPEDMLKGVTESQAQIEQTRGSVCGAAAKQAAQIRKMQSQQPRQPAPGSGVRLPQGAL